MSEQTPRDLLGLGDSFSLHELEIAAKTAHLKLLFDEDEDKKRLDDAADALREELGTVDGYDPELGRDGPAYKALQAAVHSGLEGNEETVDQNRHALSSLINRLSVIEALGQELDPAPEEEIEDSDEDSDEDPEGDDD